MNVGAPFECRACPNFRLTLCRSLHSHAIFIPHHAKQWNRRGTDVEQSWNSRGTVLRKAWVFCDESYKCSTLELGWAGVEQSWNSRGTVAKCTRERNVPRLHYNTINRRYLGTVSAKTPKISRILMGGAGGPALGRSDQ